MFPRLKLAFGLALILVLVTSISVFAKGGFSFIMIAGPKMIDAVRATDPALTTDFFAFADFSRDSTKAQSDPGTGYEITRYYIDGKREIAFDRLHYYPDTGFVYYDGIVNGSSEYDGEWYTANTGIQTAFESALSVQIKSAPPASQPRSVTAVEQTQPGKSTPQIQILTIIAIIAGFAGILGLAFWFRKLSTQ